MSLLSTAKQNLIERATEIFTDTRGDLKPGEYAEHYKTLGDLVAKIDQYESLSDIIKSIEMGEFSLIGLNEGDEDLVYFMEDVLKAV